jgi:large subunit ribosomal protein L29
MKAEELREKSVEDLNSLLVELTKTEFEQKYAHKLNKLEKPHLIKNTRRDIARVKTVLAEKAGK